SETQPPTRHFCYPPPLVPSPAPYFIEIQRLAGGGTPRLDLYNFFTIGDGSIQYSVTSGSVTEPATSPSVMAVGAICWQNNALESFSSQGPTIDGRTKPDIAGQDATSSSVYGLASGCFAGFPGTSASAPHVTGAAALVLQTNPTFTPAELQAFLEGRALELGAAGKDNQFGSGRLWR